MAFDFENGVDPDYGMLVRSKLLSLGLEIVEKDPHTYQYTDRERKAVIANALKQIYSVVGVHSTPDINELADTIYGNYKGLSFRNFPKLTKPIDADGQYFENTLNRWEEVNVLDERNWTHRRRLIIVPRICRSVNRSIPSQNLYKLLKFFTARPVHESELNIIARQIEETMKMMYLPEHKFEIKIDIRFEDSCF